MKITHYSLIALIIICASSCKKNTSETLHETKTEVILKDSVSFIVNNTQYVFNEKNTFGVSNRAVNIKPSKTLIKDGKLGIETGGVYWYGTKDSTMYSVFQRLGSNKLGEEFGISFNKRFSDNQLHKSAALLVPKDNAEIFRLGKIPFAVDLDKENTMDGISIDFRAPGLTKNLSTVIPGFSILVRSGLKKDIQDNSSFEITKIEKIQDSTYLLEAKFELNLFNTDEQLYRVKNGFLRLRVNMVPRPGFY